MSMNKKKSSCDQPSSMVQTREVAMRLALEWLKPTRKESESPDLWEELGYLASRIEKYILEDEIIIEIEE